MLKFGLLVALMSGVPAYAPEPRPEPRRDEPPRPPHNKGVLAVFLVAFLAIFVISKALEVMLDEQPRS